MGISDEEFNTQNGAVTPAIARWVPAVGLAAQLRSQVAPRRPGRGLTLAAYLCRGDRRRFACRIAGGGWLYACLFSGLAFWLFCSSKHTAIALTPRFRCLSGRHSGTGGGGLRPLGAWRPALPCWSRGWGFWPGGQRGGDRGLHFRRRHGRVQVRDRAGAHEHAVAEALRLSGEAGGFREDRATSSASQRDQFRRSAWASGRWWCSCWGRCF